MNFDVRTVGVVILVITVAAFVVTEVAKRTYTAKLSYLLKQGDAREYLKTLDAPLVRFVFPKWNRLFMRLNGLLMIDSYAEIDALLPEMLSMRQNDEQRRELVGRAFNYYVEREKRPEAAKLLDEIDSWGDRELAEQAHMTFDIFLDGSYAHIDEMERRLKSVAGVDRAFLQLLLSVQYKNKGDERKSREYLERSEAGISDAATSASAGSEE